ncbi:MAG: putative transport system permease protein [Pseudonocardiales bacterium]|jgi:putative ABC transport system permease protein|nr:putative transport system permease protein [Pseudonocardiales bacterium]
MDGAVPRNGKGHKMSQRLALFVALRGLRAHRLRSALTMLSLIIGVSAMILLVACGYGVKNSVNARVETMANEIGIVPTTAGIPGGPPARNLTDADASALQDAPDVATVTPSIYSSGIVIASGTVKLISATTVGTTEIWAATHNRVLTAGSFFDQAQGRRAARVAVVGPTVASTLFGEPPAALNQTVQINHVPFQVIGVMASYGQQEDNTAVVPLGTARRYIVGYGMGTGNALNAIIVQATQQAAVPAAMAQVTRILDARHHINDPRLRDFQIQSLGHRLQTFEQIVGILVLFIPVIAVSLLIVGGIGVLNIMLASVTERTREVSIRDASSATSRAILKQVLIESIVLAGLGGLIGVGVGISLIFLIQAVAPTFSGALAGFTPVLSLPPVVAAFAISLMIGLIAGSYPAYRAARLLPIQPLRYQ